MTKLLIAQHALDDARDHFERCGQRGLEGTAMLAGPPDRINRCVIPDQLGRRSALGVSVEVTARGKLQLVSALQRGERYHARIHSHPRNAFHSAADDANPVLTAEGALSIVVPDFGRGLRRGLAACAVYELRNGRWLQLNYPELVRRVKVTP